MLPKIGILCAGDDELAPFLPLLDRRSVRRQAMLTIHEGWISSVPAAALYSGVCKVNAAIAAQVLIDSCRVEAIINAGTAGGIDPSISIFDTVISTETAYHDVAEDILTEFHPWMDSIWFPGDPFLLSLATQAAQDSGRPVRFGRMVTGEAFLSGPGQRPCGPHFTPFARIWNPRPLPMSAMQTASHSSPFAPSPIRPTDPPPPALRKTAAGLLKSQPR